MAGAFLYSNVVTGAVGLSNPTSTPTLPLSNLLDPQPRIRARVDATSLALVVDLQASQAIDCVGLLSTNLDTIALPGMLLRVLLSTVDPTGAAGDAWNSGQVAPSTDASCNGNVVVVRAAGPATGRYLRINISPTLAPIDIGLVVAGQLWRPSRAHAYGIEEGRLILDRRERNSFTGAEFPVAAVGNPRTARFTLPALTTAEARGAFRTMVATLGAAGDALWIPDLSLSQAELNARSLWGSVATAGDVMAAAMQKQNVHSRAFSITERL